MKTGSDFLDRSFRVFSCVSCDTWLLLLVFFLVSLGLVLPVLLIPWFGLHCRDTEDLTTEYTEQEEDEKQKPRTTRKKARNKNTSDFISVPIRLIRQIRV